MNGGRWTDRYCDDGTMDGPLLSLLFFWKFALLFTVGKKTDYWDITVVDNVIDSNEEVTE
jgi:hypothetical protein